MNLPPDVEERISHFKSRRLNPSSQEKTEDEGVLKSTPKLGSVDPKSLIRDHDGERVSRGFVDISIKLDEGIIELAAENILLLERTPEDTLTILEVEKQLSTLSAYRFAFIRAQAIISKLVKKKNRELKAWLAGKRRDIIKDIGKFRIRMRENEGFSNSWFGSITKDEVQERLELDNEFTIKQDEIETLEEQETILKGLHEVMGQHSSNLRRLYEQLNFEKLKT